MSGVPAVRREIVVTAPPAVAFDVFIHGIGTWWPVETHSVHGSAASVTFVGREIIESAEGFPDSVWGTVLEWDPPHRIAFTWHPGRSADNPSHVEVSFEAVEGGTAVRLVHSQWESFADPVAARGEYEQGWPVVLDAFAGSFPLATWTWVALLHTATIDGNVFADERFPLHAAFLDRMADAGYLVAAGPLLDAPGDGMTILRLPGDDRFADATALATTDDQSVVQGLFDVSVRPWHVVSSVLQA